jgi:hypothetical protein
MSQNYISLAPNFSKLQPDMKKVQYTYGRTICIYPSSEIKFCRKLYPSNIWWMNKCEFLSFSPLFGSFWVLVSVKLRRWETHMRVFGFCWNVAYTLDLLNNNQWQHVLLIGQRLLWKQSVSKLPSNRPKYLNN